jgi:hypothetical protein
MTAASLSRARAQADRRRASRNPKPSSTPVAGKAEWGRAELRCASVLGGGRLSGAPIESAPRNPKPSSTPVATANGEDGIKATGSAAFKSKESPVNLSLRGGDGRKLNGGSAPRNPKHSSTPVAGQAGQGGLGESEV